MTCRKARFLIASMSTLALAMALAGCSGSPKGEAQTSNETGTGNRQSSQSTQRSDTAGRPRGLPGASGEIVAIDGTTLQVQNSQSQTSVSYSASTKFTDTVTASAGDLKVGSCVTARPATDPNATTAPSLGNEPTSIDAVTIVITQPVNGECTGGFGGFRGNAAPGARPSGAPSGELFADGGPEGSAAPAPNGAAPSGATGPDGQRLRGIGGLGAVGRIVSISGNSFVLDSVRLALRATQSGSANASPSAAPTTTAITVRTTSSTAYRKVAAATNSALAVGKCATAFGTADDTGAIKATSIALRPKENGACGFGGPDA